MAFNFQAFLLGRRWHLLVITAVVLTLQLWMVVEAAVMWRRIDRERRLRPGASGAAAGEAEQQGLRP